MDVTHNRPILHSTNNLYRWMRNVMLSRGGDVLDFIDGFMFAYDGCKKFEGQPLVKISFIIDLF